MEQPFQINTIYKRSLIHDQYGGNRQGGISASARYPYIFIFSGSAGHQHGYKDQWENEDVFSYTGEGQVSDMQFVKGNLALRDHLKSGKRIFLFIEAPLRSHVVFVSELELREFDFFLAPDREGKERTAIKFFFQRVGKQLDYPKAQTLSSMVWEEKAPYTWNKPNETERQGLVTSRVGQGAYRKSILYRWKFRCAVTGFQKNEILIASHILPWREATNEERLDVNNGILLSPTYDALFDRHLISFEDSGKIILSEALRKTNYSELGITGRELIKELSDENRPYLMRHRNSLGDQREKILG
jgi:5-methylcytosine-specific restriction protein A